MTLDVGTAYTARFGPVLNSSGTQVTPATVTLAVTQPDLTPFAGSPFTVTPALGIQSQTFTPVQPGLHQLTWTLTGPTLVKTDYVPFRNFISGVSFQQAKDRLGSSASFITNDETIRDLMAAATREAEKIVGLTVPRQFTKVQIPGTYRDLLRVPHGPIFMPPSNTAVNGSVTFLGSVYPAGPTWPAGGDTNELVVAPSPGTIRHAGLIPFWYGPWLVTYIGGRLYIEEDISQGILEILWDLFQFKRGLTADMAMAAEQGLTVPPYYRPPARALSLLKGYEMPGFG